MVKINSKHKKLYTSQKRYVYEKGGRGSGKSFAVTDYCIRVSYDTNRVILFLRYTMVSATISIVPEFEAAMERIGAEEDFEIVGSEIVNKRSGSKIIFKGVKTSSLNQTANLKSIQGLTDVIYDEFEEHPDKESFDKLDESIREVSAANKLVLVSNALHKQSWQYKEFWQESGLYYSMTDHVVTTFEDNIKNLSDSWHKKRELVKERDPDKYDRDYLGIDYEEIEGALWSRDIIKHVDHVPDLVRIVVSIDPSVTSNKDSDECGIIAGGVCRRGNVYILSDLTDILSPSKWAKTAIAEYHRLQADRIVAEVNNGGDLVESNIKMFDKSVSYKAVRATRGKEIRAEPVVSLYEEGKVFHSGILSKLENEQTSWVPHKSKSPNRVDALVWLVTDLVLTKGSFRVL